MTARTGTAEQRIAIRSRLLARNRVISILRIGLPVLGVLVLVAFFLQIFVASLADSFGIGKVSFNGNTLVVDTPSYSGVMANGDIYKISAEAASTAVTQLDVIDMRNGTVTLTTPEGRVLAAHAAAGSFATGPQTMTVPGAAQVTDSAGNSGILNHVLVNLPQQTLTSSGGVTLSLRGGATVIADGLDYSAATGQWHFTRATLTVPEGTIDTDTPAPGTTP